MASPSAAALAQLRARLHDRYFVPVANPHGVSGADTVFHYQVEAPAPAAPGRDTLSHGDSGP